MENTPDLGDEMDLFFSTEKSFQYLGITPGGRNSAVCVEGGLHFISF